MRNNKTKRWMGAIAALVVFGLNASLELRGNKAEVFQISINELNTYLRSAKDEVDDFWKFLGEKNIRLTGSNVNNETRDGALMITQACGNRRIKIAEKLVELGANVDLQRNYDRSTALHLVANNGFLDICLFLLPKMSLEAIGSRNRANKTALELAQNKGNTAIVNAIRDRIKELENANTSPSDDVFAAIMKANMDGNTPALLRILKSADMTSVIGDLKWTPLHLAAALGNIDAVNGILGRSAGSLNAQDELGQTPLILATIFGREGVIDFLKTRGANAEIKDNGGQTAEDWAKLMRHNSY